MSLRKTSCTACVSAKRRCDRGVPACLRCTQKSLMCEYSYPVTSQPIAPGRPSQNEPVRSNEIFPGFHGVVNDFETNEIMYEPEFLGSGTPNIDGLVDAHLGSVWVDSNSQIASELPSMEHMIGSEVNIPNEALRALIDPYSDERASSRSEKATELSELSRRRRKRLYRGSQQAGQNVQVLSNIARGPPNGDIWPRGRDVETWTFCARKLLSFVDSFATMASNPFILQPVLQRESSYRLGLHPLLQKALGICASYCTLGEASQNVLDQMLEAEVQQLVESSKLGGLQTQYNSVAYYGRGDGFDGALFAFREDLARVQAMTLYQIIGLFSSGAGRQRLAKKHEALLASWTRELLLRSQVLELKSGGTSASFSASTTAPEQHIYNQGESEDPHSVGDELSTASDQFPLQKEEIESAYRTVLVSFLARSVYSALVDKICPMLLELGSLPVLVPQQQLDELPSHGSDREWWSQLRQKALAQGFLNASNHTIRYHDFANLSNQQTSMEEHDPFIILLLVACKGVDIVKGRA